LCACDTCAHFFIQKAAAGVESEPSSSHCLPHPYYQSPELRLIQRLTALAGCFLAAYIQT
jgi:hypothetical protein